MKWLVSALAAPKDLQSDQKWALPPLQRGGVAKKSLRHEQVFSAITPLQPPPELVESTLAAAREEGYAAGLDQGLADGRARGEAEAKAANAATAANLANMVSAAQQAMLELDEQLRQQLCEIVSEAVQVVVQGELALDSAVIMRVVSRALQDFAGDRAKLEVRLNPADAALVRNMECFAKGVQLKEDSGISRGGCYLTNGASELDATLESRLAGMRFALTEIQDPD